jgi:hypothetical protein
MTQAFSKLSLTRCHILGRECPEAVLPDRALSLVTFSHLSIVVNLLSQYSPSMVEPVHPEAVSPPARALRLPT